MKRLGFKDFKAQLILDGLKSSSMRLFDDKDLQEGDQLELINTDTDEPFGTATIIEVVEKPLGEVKDSDLVGHERWESNEEMMASFRRFYGDKVTEDLEVKIVRFNLNS